MIVVDQVVLSDDIADECFVCDLDRCKGACCVEGESGAPLDEEETHTLKDIYEQVAPFLRPEGRKEIEKQGYFVIDSDGDFTTPLIRGKECAYTVFDKSGKAGCGIEKAWQAGATSFRKPISCHLYPIRMDKYEHYYAVNYHQWHICKPGCKLGQSLQVPLYKFLKEALVRKFGAEWYAKLETAIAERQ